MVNRSGSPIKSDTSLLRGKWPLVMSFIVVPLVLFYWWYAESKIPSGGSFEGLTLGLFSFLFLIFLISYKVRKHIYTYAIGSAQAWASAHIYISVIVIITVLMHTGFQVSGGYSVLLMLLFILVSASGVVGSIIYSIIPLSTTKFGGEVLTKTDTIEKLKGFLTEADALIEKTSDTFKEVYKNDIRSLFEPSWKKLVYAFTEEKVLLEECSAKMISLNEKIPQEEQFDLSLLSDLLVEKERLTFRFAKLTTLQTWLNFHTPLVFALLTAVIFHLLLVWYF